MFDVLVYLYENYWRPDACPEHDQLTRKLSSVGFESEEIEDALTWLDGLAAAEAADSKVFHAGSARVVAGRLVASGGRVLNVTALGSSVAEAQAAAYRAVDKVDFSTGFCRRDIGWREVAREQS